MKCIIAGSREITDPNIVAEAVKASGFKITKVVSGGARGADRLGQAWAIEHKVPLVVMSADWHKHGKAAGYIRNKEMAEESEALVACWDGKSLGTKNMITIAKKLGLKVYVHTP